MMLTKTFWSLEELMRRFQPEHYSAVMSTLGQFVLAMDKGGVLPNLSELERLFNDVGWMRVDCRMQGFTVAAAAAERLLEVIKKQDSTPSQLANACRYLRDTFYDEVKGRMFLQIEPEKANLALEPNHFGTEVTRAFPSTAWDIEETARCLAFDRWTAAVFHLGRVAEIALVAISRQVGYDSPKEGFGEALKYMDNNLEKVRKDYQNANPRFKGDVEFLAGITAQMHAVNQAWRQRVAHMDRKYTEEEAMRVWEATKGLMQHLATRLTESGSGVTG